MRSPTAPLWGLSLMPRRKPDEVVVHRLELGAWERDRVETLVTTSAFNQVIGPVVGIISNPLAMGGILLALLALFFPNLPRDWFEQTKDMTRDQLDDWLEWQNLTGAWLGGAIGGGITGGPVGALIGALLGMYVTEQVEDEIQESIEAQAHRTQMGWAAFLIGINHAYQTISDIGEAALS